MWKSKKRVVYHIVILTMSHSVKQWLCCSPAEEEEDEEEEDGMCDVVMEEDGTVEEESQTTVADDKSATMLDPDIQPVDGESQGLYEGVSGEYNLYIFFRVIIVCLVLNFVSPSTCWSTWSV